MKNLFLLLCLFFCSITFCFAQNVPDFVISGDGGYPSFDLDSDNNMHVVWDSVKDEQYLKYAIYDSHGKILKPSDTFTSRIGTSNPIIKISNNFAALVWTELLLSFRTLIYGKTIELFNSTISNNETEINDEIPIDAPRFHPDVSYLNDTLFIVVWTGDGVLTKEYGVYGQLLTTSMRKIGTNFLLNDNGDEGITYGSVKAITLTKNGNIAILWRDNHTGSAKIYCRLVSPDGIPLNNSFIVSEDTVMQDVFFLNADRDSAGNFVVIWCAEKTPARELQWRWFDKNGKALGQSEIISSDNINWFSTVDMSIDKDGSSVAVWEKNEGEYYALYCQRFTPERKPLGKPFQVSSNNTDYKKQVFPNIILKNGKIYSVWEDYIDTTSSIVGNIIDFYNPPVSVKETNISEYLFNFTISPNYPNPFNPSTIIRYQLPSDAHVTIKIYDIPGREVATLTNEILSAGNHEAIFNGSGLSSGVYIYTLTVKSNTVNYTASKKMMLLK